MPPGGRDPLDRLLMSAPGLMLPLIGAVNRLPPGSALRRRAVNMQVRRGFRTMARSDVDAMLPSYEPDAEVWMSGLDGVGVGGCYRGHEQIRGLIAELDEVFSEWEWIVGGIVDGGDRIAVRCDFRALGRRSGVETAIRNGGTAARISRRGLVERQDWFGEQDGWARALEVAELQT